MSPSRPRKPPPDKIELEHTQVVTRLGDAIRLARTRRHWSLARLATEAGLSRAGIGRVEQGRGAALATYLRLADALSLDATFELQPRRRRDRIPDEDPVHAAMGEFEARRFRSLEHEVRIDEPYQHYQFAGRADVVAIDAARSDLLHIENRTRLPNLGETAGAYNPKVRWLGAGIALPDGMTRFRSETHVLVLLWSSEVLHTLRLRTETMRALGPDAVRPFERWWNGEEIPPGRHRGLVIIDPLDRPGRARRWIGLDEALTARPRYLGYADALEALRKAGVA